MVLFEMPFFLSQQNDATDHSYTLFLSTLLPGWLSHVRDLELLALDVSKG